MLNSYRAVLFDLDGTLVNHSDAARAGVIAWSRELGISPDPARWLALEQQWFLAFERGEVTHSGQRAARVREYLCEPKLSETAALQLFDGFLYQYIASMQPFSDAAEVLEQCFDCGQLVGIATNGAADLQTAKLRTTGLWDDRLIMLAAVEIGAVKPNPEFYARALDIVGTAPSDTIMVGDSLPNDILAPIAAGIAAIHVDHAGTGTADPRYPTIRGLSELLNAP